MAERTPKPQKKIPIKNKGERNETCYDALFIL